MESLYLNHIGFKRFCKSISGGKTKNFLPFLFRLAAGGLGGAACLRAVTHRQALKMNGNFWVLPRASLSSAGEARKVSCFLQKMFERSRIIPPFNFNGIKDL